VRWTIRSQRAGRLQVKERADKARPVVKQVKLLRSADKTDAAGKQASKGLAFVEFEDHEHALCALRQLNNNPAPFGASDARPDALHTLPRQR
jgi:nucleolar protein 4